MNYTAKTLEWVSAIFIGVGLGLWYHSPVKTEDKCGYLIATHKFQKGDLAPQWVQTTKNANAYFMRAVIVEQFKTCTKVYPFEKMEDENIKLPFVLGSVSSTEYPTLNVGDLVEIVAIQGTNIYFSGFPTTFYTSTIDSE